MPDPARADLAGRDANRAAYARPETKPARPVLAGRTLPAPSSANALRCCRAMSPAMSAVGSVKGSTKGSVKGSVLGWSPRHRPNRHVRRPKRAPPRRRT